MISVTNIWITQIDKEQFQQFGYSLWIKVGSWNIWCELLYVIEEAIVEIKIVKIDFTFSYHIWAIRPI